MKRTYTATYDIVAPMFTGRDPQNERRSPGGLRVASVKGVLRFWWRALAHSAFWNANSGTPGYDATQHRLRLHAAEAWLFGSASRGQSRLRLRLLDSAVGTPEFSDILDGGGKNRMPIGYLGYGLGATKSLPARRASKVRRFSIGATFCRRGIDETVPGGDREMAERLLPKALHAMGLFGSLGARGRRGFGSLQLVGLSCPEQPADDVTGPNTIEQYCEQVAGLLDGALAAPTPAYSAFGRGTRIDLCIGRDTCERVLTEAAFALARHRVYGQLDERVGTHVLSGPPSLSAGAPVANQMRIIGRRYELDHDGFYDASDRAVRERASSIPGAAPRRAVFGLPHSYNLRRAKSSISVVGENAERRASPLLLHVFKASGVSETERRPRQGYFLVALLLETTTFLAPGEALSTKDKSGTRRSFGNRSRAIDFQPIRDFMDVFQKGRRYRDEFDLVADPAEELLGTPRTIFG